MGTFSPGTDANGPSFWPRGGSDVRETPYCLFWNDGWRCRFLEFGYGRLLGNSPTPIYQDGQTPGSHHPGATACATDFSAVRTVPTFAMIYRSLAAGAVPSLHAVVSESWVSGLLDVALDGPSVTQRRALARVWA